MLGVFLDEPSEALIRHLQLKRGETTMVNGVFENLPAHKGGLDAYDIIVAVNGNTPAGSQQVHEALQQLNPGDAITFTVIHEGRRKDVTVNVAAYDAEAMQNATVIGEGASMNVFQRMPMNLQGMVDVEGHALPNGEIMELLVLPKMDEGEWGGNILIQPRLGLRRNAQPGETEDGSAIEEELEEGIEDAVKADMADLGERLKRLEELLKKLSEKNRQNNSDE
jgi:hypothetical protein